MGSGIDTAPSSARHRFRPLAAAALGAVLLAGSVGLGGAASPSSGLARQGATPEADLATPIAAANDPCPDELTGEGSEPWIRAELYFGTTSPDGTPYAEEEWLDFLAEEVTPRFPAGLTVLTGLGQWQSAPDAEISQERSKVLIILYPPDGAAESSALLEEIRTAYEEQFQQQSVLRADISPVCTSF